MLLKCSNNLSKILVDLYGLKENDICLKIAEYRFQNIILYKILIKGQIVLCEKSNVEEVK